MLYPTLAMWATLIGSSDLYAEIAAAKATFLKHCYFLIWSPGSDSEAVPYTNADDHGIASDMNLRTSEADFRQAVWNECNAADAMKKLSCIESGLHPLLLTACRHYRFPVPMHFTEGYKPKFAENESLAGRPCTWNHFLEDDFRARPQSRI